MPPTMLSVIVDNIVDLRDLWGSRAPIGVALTEAYFSREQSVTVDSLAARLKMGDDSIRRALDKMVQNGSVELEVVAGRRRYRCAHLMASRSLQILDRLKEFQPQSAVTAD